MSRPSYALHDKMLQSMLAKPAACRSDFCSINIMEIFICDSRPAAAAAVSQAPLGRRQQLNGRSPGPRPSFAGPSGVCGNAGGRRISGGGESEDRAGDCEVSGGNATVQLMGIAAAQRLALLLGCAIPSSILE